MIDHGYFRATQMPQFFFAHGVELLAFKLDATAYNFAVYTKVLHHP